jgi:serine/threonine-protein kinase
MPTAVRYRVVNKIAHGGMAEIFLALQRGAEGFQKPVVLKRILPALAADPAFVGMLVDEAHIASTLNHSNLVQVLDLRKSENEYFLVLEFVDGWSLEQVRQRALKAKVKLPLPLVLYIVGSLCRGLAYVHSRTRNGKPLGIVHRDVTPQNVLLSREGEVKLADFGIAKAVGKREKSATGVIKGKFAYMSPEQAAGLELDARSDLFSVGTLLYLLTTGQKPFDGATDLDIIVQVRQARFERPSTLMREFNRDVERLIVRAMRVAPQRRWQTAEQMADKMDAILVRLGQPSGPAALKRWLETLHSRDGSRTPAQANEATDLSSAIEIGSRDLELQEVPAPPDEPEPPAKADVGRRSGRSGDQAGEGLEVPVRPGEARGGCRPRGGRRRGGAGGHAALQAMVAPPPDPRAGAAGAAGRRPLLRVPPPPHVHHQTGGRLAARPPRSPGQGRAPADTAAPLIYRASLSSDSGRTGCLLLLRAAADKPARWRSRREDRTGAYLGVREERTGAPAQPASRIVGRR